MNGSQFDRVARLFAERRLSRRAALAAGGLASLGFAGVSAQDATPATPVGSDDGMAADGSVLFVQTASGGSFVPNPEIGTPEVAGTPTPGGGADYLLTLEGHPGGTVYFTDRPERVFGEAPTERFLEGLGFGAEDPPNAALVAQTESGEDGEPWNTQLLLALRRHLPRVVHEPEPRLLDGQWSQTFAAPCQGNRCGAYAFDNHCW